jgi:hypothetical protein
MRAPSLLAAAVARSLGLEFPLDLLERERGDARAAVGLYLGDRRLVLGGPGLLVLGGVAEGDDHRIVEQPQDLFVLELAGERQGFVEVDAGTRPEPPWLQAIGLCCGAGALQPPFGPATSLLCDKAPFVTCDPPVGRGGCILEP